MNPLNGFVVAPFSPMRSNGDLALDNVRPYADFLIRNGIEGAFLCGSTGEGALLTREERMMLAEEWKRQAGNRLKLIIHTGGTGIRDQQGLARHAREIGAFGIAAMAPAFLPPPRMEELITYCQTIASAASGLPFYYYHIPSLNHYETDIFRFLEEAGPRIPSLAGVKFTHNDPEEYARCVQPFGDRYELFWGLDEILLDGLRKGARYGVGGTYNHCFPLYRGIKEAFEQNDITRAENLQQQAYRFCEIIWKSRGNIMGGKRIMKFLGLDMGPNRLPLQSLSDNEEAAMKKELEQIGFFTFCNR